MLIHGFPYKDVKQESNVVIYGCGVAGKEYIAQIEATSWCQVHYIIDNKRNIVEYKNIPVIDYDSFKKLANRNTYIIIIAIADTIQADSIIMELKQDGIPDSQIIYGDTMIKIPIECTNNAVKFDIIPVNTVDDEIVYIQKQLIKNNLMISEIPRSITNCGKKEEFICLLEKFTKSDSYYYLDMSRLISFMLNATKVIEHIEGSVAELGVYRGDTASVLASVCQRRTKKLFLLDTFEGFSQKDLVGIDQIKQKYYSETSTSYVKNVIGDIQNVYFIKGYFPDSAVEMPEEERYCFVHIDCDLYYPIKCGLEYFWPKLNGGGMIMIHDYASGHWKGATKAVDEFCDLNKVSVVLIPDLGGSAVLVKDRNL